ncbi:MAG TPA: methyltransferase domain-containing protein, partial [Cytophagaceae bacterium]|nr:methyltransferase domain-containing protein [Cytophagaceae bacterium]
LHTPFESNTYDVVWATESVCYAENIQDFTDEAFRILKPGGRLIVADGFATPKKINKKEKSYLDKWIPYWAMKELQTEKEFSRAAHTSGFKNYIHRNYTSNIKKSVRRIYYYSIAAIFITRVYRLFGKTYGNETAYKNTIGGINQFKAYQKGLWEYYIITAVKEIEK